MFACLLLFSLAHAQSLAPEVQQAEDLGNAGDLDGVLRVLEAYTATHPDDVEGLWRLSRALYEKGEVMAQSVPDAQRIPVYERARTIAQHVEELAPDNGEGYLWDGTAIARIATARGVIASLFMAKDVEKLWLKALTTKTKYRMASGISSFPGDVYNGLGQFYRLVPDYTAVEWIAGTRGDIDKSVHYFRLMVDDDPHRLEAQKELGVALLCKGYKQDDNAAKAEGRMWLNKALTLPYSYPTDVIDHKQIPIILSREADACGYSRDGWEDVSEKAVNAKK
jgi:tetratricopeptide (TPR) repeat protein